MSEPFHGVLPALITPFTEDGDAIDTDALAAIVERLIGAGVGGLVPGGSTGEFTTLTHAERRQLVEVTVEAAAGRVPVVAGTGALSTRETVELSVHAEQAGAAAVMIVPPFYDALSWRELLAHYTAVADAIAIPIMYYNLPARPGVTLTAEQLRELPGHVPQGHRRRRRRRDRADPDRRPDAAQRLGHAHLRRARRRRARRRLGHRLDRPRAVRRAAPAADRRHRPARRARAVGAHLAAVPVPRGPELLGRGQGRLRASSATPPARSARRCCRSTTPRRASSPRCSTTRRSRRSPRSRRSYAGSISLTAAPPYRRDAMTWAVYSGLLAFGFLNAVLGPALPYLRATEHISYLVSAFHQVAFAIGGGLAGLIAVRTESWFGRGTTIRVGLVCAAIAALGIGYGGSVEVTVFSAFLVSLFGTSALVRMWAALADAHGGGARWRWPRARCGSASAGS